MEIENPAFVQTVEESFVRQGLLRHLGARLVSVEPGEVRIDLPVTAQISQQRGFVHAGAMTAAVDSACGYAALTLLPAECDVLTVEYKVNFLAPAQGNRLLAVGQVVKSGRTVTVCRGDVYMIDAEKVEVICATMLATMIIRR